MAFVANLCPRGLAVKWISHKAPPGTGREWRHRDECRRLLIELGAHGPIDAIAVLPLENLSGETSQEYFADAMTEALIAELGKIGALRVISRTSVMLYKDAGKPLSEIARELRVDAIVEGSVLRSGQEVRIRAQLVQANPERQLWVDSYEGDLSDILALQSDVAREIARQIQVTVTPQEQKGLAQARPVNPEAYEAYLLGRHHLNRGTPEDLNKAIGYFQQAIDTCSPGPGGTLRTRRPLTRRPRGP